VIWFLLFSSGLLFCFLHCWICSCFLLLFSVDGIFEFRMIPFLLFTSNDHGNEYDERYQQQQKTHSIPIGASRLHQRHFLRPLSSSRSSSIARRVLLFCTLSPFSVWFYFSCFDGLEGKDRHFQWAVVLSSSWWR
jgi:hypothetical protein